MKDTFRRFAHAIADAAGTPWAFIVALLFVIGWAAFGPSYGYSSEWQLVINTATTILTFLIVFLIQNAQNRDSKAIQLKLDELLRVIGKARTSLVDLEDLSDDELNSLETEFRAVSERARQAAERRMTRPAALSPSQRKSGKASAK